MNIESLILDLAFILLLGAVVTVLFKWIKQPVVLGYIVAGFLASPQFTYLPSVASDANIHFWAEIGIVVLLFSLGLEFSFKKLVNSGGSAVVTALIIVVGMMGAGYVVGYAMGFSSINCLFLGGMLSMSSTTIIIKAFTDLGLRQKKFASQVLAVLIVEDLFAVVMMVILSSIAAGNSVEGIELVYSVAKLVFFLVIWFLVGTYVLPSAFKSVSRFLNSETLLIVSMGLCLGMAVFSVYCGFSLALGAFVMGSILAGTSYAERIEHVVTPVKDLFGAVFFISVGMMVNPAVIANYWPSILLLSAVVIVGMIVFGTFGMLVTGQTLRVAIQSGFSLTQIGEFAFIIATLGMSLGVLDASLYPIIVAVSVLTTFTTPMFIKMSLPVCEFVERHLPGRLRFLIDRYQKNVSQEQASTALYNPQNETCDALRTKRAKIKTKRFSFSKRSVPLRRFSGHPLFKKNRPGFAGIFQPPGSVFEWPPNIVRRPFFFAFRFGSLRDRFLALRSRDFDYRFIRGHALRFDEFAAEGQTRPDTRVRIRCIVTRIHVRHAATRIRVVVAAIDHTAC